MRTRPVCPVPRAHERRARERPRMQGEGGEAEERRQAGRGRRKRPDPRWRSAHVQERRAAMAERPLSAPDEHTNARISQLRRKMRPPLPPASHVEHENEEPSAFVFPSRRGGDEGKREGPRRVGGSSYLAPSPFRRQDAKAVFILLQIRNKTAKRAAMWRLAAAAVDAQFLCVPIARALVDPRADLPGSES